MFPSPFQLHKRTVHSLYVIQPQKKEALKLLVKLLTPSKFYPTSLKVNETTHSCVGGLISAITSAISWLLQKVLLKEISELSNYIDKSQLPASLGGYLIYSHQSWASFVKVILFSVGKSVNIWTVAATLKRCLECFWNQLEIPCICLSKSVCLYNLSVKDSASEAFCLRAKAMRVSYDQSASSTRGNIVLASFAAVDHLLLCVNRPSVPATYEGLLLC